MNETTALLMAAILPLLTNHLTPKPTAPPSLSAATPPATPSCKVVIATPLAPAPDTGLELHICLGDFLKSKGIDITVTEAVLMELELMPDIVSEVPVARLCEVMGTVEGQVHKFQVFHREWSAHLEDKKKRSC